MNNLRRILSFVLCLVCAVSGASLLASAEEAAEETTIYFEVPEDWYNFKTVFCHIWEYGEDSFASWQSKKERCTLVEGNLYSYDISKAGVLEEGKTYGVIFSLDIGAQTYDTLMTTACIGDTLYCNETRYENPADNSKICRPAFWRNQDPAVLGPLMQFTSIGNLIGECLPPETTTESMFDIFLSVWLDNARQYSGKDDQRIIDGIASKLGLSEEKVRERIDLSGREVDWRASWEIPWENDKETEDGFRYQIDEEKGVAIIVDYKGSAIDVVIPENVEGYPVASFYMGNRNPYYENNRIEMLYLPASLDTLGSVGGLKNLKEIAVSPRNEYLSYEKGVLFNKDKTALLAYPSAKENRKYEVPKDVTEISAEAFSGNRYIRTIVLPDSIEEISPNAFSACASLDEIKAPEDNEYYSDIDGVLFNKDLTELVCYPAGKTATFYTVPETVQSLAHYSFAYNISLLTEGLEVIGGYAFSNMSALESIEIPSLVTELCSGLFGSSYNLAYVIIPKTVSTIDEAAFDDYSDTKIYGYHDTVAQAFAEEKEMTFAALDDILRVGDVNLDGNINVRDATDIQKHTASISQFSETLLRVADFDGDGKVSVRDATAVQKAVAGIG